MVKHHFAKAGADPIALKNSYAGARGTQEFWVKGFNLARIYFTVPSVFSFLGGSL